MSRSGATEEDGFMAAVLRNLHFGFTVSNLERTVTFFRDCLGLTVQTRGRDLPEETAQFVGVPGADLNYCVMAAPDHTIELMEYLGPPDRIRLNSRPCDVGFSHLSYLVSDLDAFIEDAARFDVYPVNPPLSFPTHGCRGIYMRDPDGLAIEVIQNLPGSAHSDR
jgi:catechol 2,3-dioxygenase-like lactoylglutathione lyase family enzyme